MGTGMGFCWDVFGDVCGVCVYGGVCGVYGSECSGVCKSFY